MLCSYVDVGLCSIEVRIVTLHMKLRETTISWLHHELTYLDSISAVSRGMSAGSFSRIAAGNRAYVILSNGKSPRLLRQQACNEHNIEVVNRHQGRWASRKIDRVPGVPIIKMTTF